MMIFSESDSRFMRLRSQGLWRKNVGVSPTQRDALPVVPLVETFVIGEKQRAAERTHPRSAV